MINLPSYAKKAIDILENAGFDAYIVGGCVRDTLLSRTASDYDITTNALPQQTALIFSSYNVIDTGLKHGTLTVIIDKTPIEITTYRVDGEYKDNRRPESVFFTNKIEQDLSRRDFTVNAMAYSPKNGIIDCFGGKSDLEKKIIRCVGDADKRFGEDALRILRAMRFAAVLEFEIADNTAKSIHKNKNLLKNISAERIQAEFFKLICGKNAVKIINEYKDVLSVFIPQIIPMFGFKQHSKYHFLDVWHHSLCALESTAPKPALRLAALFHDIGKPDAFTIDDEGFGHFYSHAKFSIEHTRSILNSLKCDNATKNRVLTLIKYHDAVIHPTKKSVKKWLGKLGEDMFFELMELQSADTHAHAKQFVDERLSQIARIKSLAEEIINEGECFSLRDLAVNGKDMIEAGFVNAQIGQALSLLLDKVINGEIDNNKDVLIKKAKEIKHNGGI